MDRLSAVIGAAVLLLVACDDKKQEPVVSSRTNAAKVSATQGASTAAFCDVHHPGDTGPVFKVPPLVGGELPAKASGWRWVNVWATWCKPCVEEMPRLAKWREKLDNKFELAFVSVDEDDADLAAFRKDHPESPASPRLADLAKQAEWYAAVGLDGSPPIPIHIFVTPKGHVRCARAGGVREADFAAVEMLFTE
jgi:thiol-disulfide isomerase/thioredoxin